MEDANKADHAAGPTMLVTDATVDASPFNSPRCSGAVALLIAKEMPVRNYSPAQAGRKGRVGKHNR